MQHVLPNDHHFFVEGHGGGGRGRAGVVEVKVEFESMGGAIRSGRRGHGRGGGYRRGPRTVWHYLQRIAVDANIYNWLPKALVCVNSF